MPLSVAATATMPGMAFDSTACVNIVSSVSRVGIGRSPSELSRARAAMDEDVRLRRDRWRPAYSRIAGVSTARPARPRLPVDPAGGAMYSGPSDISRGGRPMSEIPRRSLGEGSPVSAVHFHPMDPEFVADPYPTYHRLRAEDPVHHSPLGFWVLTRYEDVVAVLRDPRFVKEPIAAVVAARLGGATPAGAALDAGARSPGPHAAARSRQQGVHPARGGGAAAPHPADRRRPPRPRGGRPRHGPDRGLRLPAARHRHLRAARGARGGPRPVQGVGARHRARSRRHPAPARTRRWSSAAPPPAAP